MPFAAQPAAAQNNSRFHFDQRILTMRTLVAVVFAAALGFALNVAAAPKPPSHSGSHASSTGSKSTGSGEHVSRGGKSGSR
jgi:hypothetical protein